MPRDPRSDRTRSACPPSVSNASNTIRKTARRCTPIYDIKPYIPYTDAHPEAAGGFAAEPDKTIEVVFPPDLLRQLPEKQHAAVFEVLAQDPRPSYRADGEREYGLYFAGANIRFRVEDGVLTVISVRRIQEGQ